MRKKIATIKNVFILDVLVAWIGDHFLIEERMFDIVRLTSLSIEISSDKAFNNVVPSFLLLSFAFSYKIE